ncbi:MAG: deoxyribonuclease II family protein [Pseudomonadales bacterium]|nr:deoxyribonuclease II family protein [Pseudomonadales bacterium]
MLAAKNDVDGADVDWWFMYKLPEGVGRQAKTTGNEYLYYDGVECKKLTLSPHRLGTAAQGALFHTMNQLFDSASGSSDSIGWIHYNDEYPYSLDHGDWAPKVPPKYYSEKAREKDRGHPVDCAHNGHCKGTLMFDLESDTAVWLAHSTPRIPDLHEDPATRFFYPDYAYKYAQTFICITLKNVATANQIAAVLARQHEPQVFGCKLPERVTQDSQWSDLWTLAQGHEPPAYSQAYVKEHGKRPPTDMSFQSSAGKDFRLIAKSGAWMDDFWINLVGPTLQTDLRVETWRRLTATAGLPVDTVNGQAEFGDKDFETDHNNHEYHHEFEDGDQKHLEDEITTVDLSVLTDAQGQPLTGISWSYTHDHAKWSISESDAEHGVHTLDTEPGTAQSWICVADINRMTSQEKRGGGAICFHERALWQDLNEIEKIDGQIT